MREGGLAGREGRRRIEEFSLAAGDTRSAPKVEETERRGIGEATWSLNPSPAGNTLEREREWLVGSVSWSCYIAGASLPLPLSPSLLFTPLVHGARKGPTYLSWWKKDAPEWIRSISREIVRSDRRA